MTIVLSICPIPECRFHHTPVYAEIVQTKAHIKTHDYKILLKTAFDLGIISNPDERRNVNWLVDELFESGKHLAGVAMS